MNITIIKAKTAKHIEKIRSLFRQYEKELGIDLCFQDFETELSSLPYKYAPPEGALLMAIDQKQEAAGCVALRKLEVPSHNFLPKKENGFLYKGLLKESNANISEMKRLFVLPKYRGEKVGRMLAQSIIDAAYEIGYSKMRLDTLKRLNKAIKLYQSLGFKKIAPYYHNPIDGAVYLELNLKKSYRYKTSA